jgi:hypothetical protein
MKLFHKLVVLFGLALFCADYSSIVRADEWDKATKVTFGEAVQVPGAVLEPGTYVFKLADSQSDRHIVQIFNEDHTALITTVLAVPNYRLEPAGKTILTYDERPAAQPVALAAWFYPGDNFGQEFIYPKSRARELSRLNHREVPSTDSDEGAPSERPTSNAEETVTPPQPKVESNPTPTEPTPRPAAAQPAPTSVPTASPEARQLPQTASLLPVVGIVGFALLGAALALRLGLRA